MKMLMMMMMMMMRMYVQHVAAATSNIVRSKCDRIVSYLIVLKRIGIACDI